MNSITQVDEGLHPYVYWRPWNPYFSVWITNHVCLHVNVTPWLFFLKETIVYLKFLFPQQKCLGQFDTSGTAVLLEFASIEIIVCYIEGVYPNKSVVPFEIRDVRVFLQWS